MSVEQALADYLRGVLDCDVTMGLAATAGRSRDHPQGPTPTVTVEQVGGGVTAFFATAIFAVQAWAPTRHQAADLAEEVADAIVAWPHREARVAYGRVVSLYYFPDPDTRRERYQLSVETMIATQRRTHDGET